VSAVETVVLSTRVEPELRESLVKHARREDRTLAGTVRHAVRIYLDEQNAPRAAERRVGA
jgi:hypothetical protein